MGSNEYLAEAPQILPPASFWATLEIAKDPEILQSVRREAEDCLIDAPEGEVRFDNEKLLKKPLIQAVCAETLRLRVHGIIPRKSPQEGVNVRGSLILGHTLFFKNSTTEHMDPKVWCTGAAKDHVVDLFESV